MEGVKPSYQQKRRGFDGFCVGRLSHKQHEVADREDEFLVEGTCRRAVTKIGNKIQRASCEGRLRRQLVRRQD